MSRGDADEQSTVRAASQSGAGGARSPRRGDSEAGGMLVYDDFAVTNDPTTGIPGRPSLRAELRRRKLLWVTAAVVGLAMGIGLYKEMPPPYKATALVHIAVAPGTQALDEILTEVNIAQSRKVALQAMTELNLPPDPKSVQRFMGSEAVTSPSDQFVLFTVKASSADDAVARARALAAAYVQLRAAQLKHSLQMTIDALNKAIARQQNVLAQLPARIATVQAQPTSAAQQAKLASLQAQQKQLPGRLRALQKAATGYETSTQVNNLKVINGSGKWGDASATPRSKIKYPALYAVGGLFAGLAIGMGWVIVSALISTRPRRRYDIARALGAPVRLSIGRIRVSKLSARRAPESAGGRGIQQIATHLRGVIGRERGRATLAVVAADDTIVPALSVISTAFAFARDGKRVIFADLTSGADGGRLLGCTEPGVHRHIAGQRNLTVVIPENSIAPPTGPIRYISAEVPPSGDPELDYAYHSADLLLTLLTINPALGADHLPTWARDAVMILTAGKPSATKIRTTAELIRLSGTAFVSAVIVGADKFDDSLGVLTIADDDELGEPSEDAAGRDARDTIFAQQDGSPEPSHGKQASAERNHARRETADRPRAGTDRREALPELRSATRSGGWPEVKSPQVNPAIAAETTRPDVRYDPLEPPARAVDLRKEDGRRRPETPARPEMVTQPQIARPGNDPAPETRPYADAPETVIGSEPLGSRARRG
jgi:hypothetical protein